jgi:hypothetical protein
MKTSNEGTKYMLKLATAHLAALKTRLANAEVATEFSIQKQQLSENRGGYASKREAKYETFVIKVTDTFVYEWDKDQTVNQGTKVICMGRTEYVKFDDVRKEIIRGLQRQIEGTEGDIVFLDKKIIDWKP